MQLVRGGLFQLGATEGGATLGPGKHNRLKGMKTREKNHPEKSIVGQMPGLGSQESSAHSTNLREPDPRWAGGALPSSAVVCRGYLKNYSEPTLGLTLNDVRDTLDT